MIIGNNITVAIISFIIGLVGIFVLLGLGFASFFVLGAGFVFLMVILMILLPVLILIALISIIVRIVRNIEGKGKNKKIKGGHKLR